MFFNRLNYGPSVVVSLFGLSDSEWYERKSFNLLIRKGPEIKKCLGFRSVFLFCQCYGDGSLMEGFLIYSTSLNIFDQYPPISMAYLYISRTASMWHPAWSELLSESI